MTAVVSLDVLPADVPAEFAPAMVSACSSALADGQCALAQTLPESARPEAVALVLWQGERLLQVTVRVGRGGGQWTARSLTFSEKDSISDRWTTVGLTVATLVGETHALDPKSELEEPAKPPAEPFIRAKPASPAAVPRHLEAPGPSGTQPVPVAAWQVSMGALGGPGWDRGSWRFGGWASLAARLLATPIVLQATGSFAAADGPTFDGDDVASRWLTLGVGAGLVGTSRTLNLTGSAALEVAYRRVDVDFLGRSFSDQEVPVRLRALGSYPAEGTLAATGGFVVRLPPWDSHQTSGFHLAGPAFGAEILAGVEVRL